MLCCRGKFVSFYWLSHIAREILLFHCHLWRQLDQKRERPHDFSQRESFFLLMRNTYKLKSLSLLLANNLPTKVLRINLSVHLCTAVQQSALIKKWRQTDMTVWSLPKRRFFYFLNCSRINLPSPQCGQPPFELWTLRICTAILAEWMLVTVSPCRRKRQNHAAIKWHQYKGLWLSM